MLKPSEVSARIHILSGIYLFGPDDFSECGVFCNLGPPSKSII